MLLDTIQSPQVKSIIALARSRTRSSWPSLHTLDPLQRSTISGLHKHAFWRTCRILRPSILVGQIDSIVLFSRLVGDKSAVNRKIVNHEQQSGLILLP